MVRRRPGVGLLRNFILDALEVEDLGPLWIEIDTIAGTLRPLSSVQALRLRIFSTRVTRALLRTLTGHQK